MPKAPVLFAPLQKIGVRALLDDHATLEVGHQVAALDCGKPVGHDEARPASHELLHGRNQVPLGAHVERGCGLVEQHDGRIPKQGPRNADTLPLSAAEHQASLPDRCVVAIGQVAQEVVQLSQPGCPLHLLIRGIWPAVSDVEADRLVEEGTILRDDAEVRAEGGRRQLAHVLAIDEHLPLVRICESVKQPQQRALAGSARPDDCGSRARRDHQRGTGQHHVGAVGQVDIPELQSPSSEV
mmetsp:Transcript_28781/g.95651  ORF Transcript_28781/g.95651 Transcript_28781/m.95651 type:complete len:240 (-) Transcript_28781:1524-2243(-)